MQSGRREDCDHPKLVKIDPVDGGRIRSACSDLRDVGKKCSPHANLWEEKESFFHLAKAFLRDMGRVPG